MPNVAQTILMVHNHYKERGGESQVFESEVQGLREHGHPLVLYTRENKDIETWRVRGKLQAIASSYASKSTADEITRLVRQQRPAVAIVQNVFPLISPSVYRVLHQLGVPIIQAVYNYRFVCPCAELYSLGEICERCVGGNYGFAITRRCYRGSAIASAWYASIIATHRLLGTFANCIAAFMVPDDFMAEKLVQGGLPRNKMWRNANPYFLPEEPCPATHEGYVLYVGRLVPQKGVMTAIDAMRHVRSSARLVLVGQGELAAEITAKIGQADLVRRVSLVGPQWGDRLATLIAGAMAVVIPSEWYDNLPQVMCQANGLGKPVLATRLSGVSEYVVDGVNGYLFAPRDTGALAGLVDRIARMSASEYAGLCHTTRSYAEQNFAYEVHYRRLLALVEMLAGREAHAAV